MKKVDRGTDKIADGRRDGKRLPQFMEKVSTKFAKDTASKLTEYEELRQKATYGLP